MGKAAAFIPVLMLIALAGPGKAQSNLNPKESGVKSKSAAEIAHELSNPNTTLGTLTFNLDYTHFKGDLPGAGDQNAFHLTFQPSLPVKLGEGVNFFARPAVPIVFYQDVPAGADGFRKTE